MLLSVLCVFVLTQISVPLFRLRSNIGWASGGDFQILYVIVPTYTLYRSMGMYGRGLVSLLATQIVSLCLDFAVAVFGDIYPESEG